MLNEWINIQNVCKIKITNIEYHRNGVSGNGFHVVTFVMKNGNKNQNMVAVLFEEQGNISVLDIDMLAVQNIAFGENSWRGDNFEDVLRKEIQDMYDERDRKWALEHPENYPTKEDLA